MVSIQFGVNANEFTRKIEVLTNEEIGSAVDIVTRTILLNASLELDNQIVVANRHENNLDLLEYYLSLPKDGHSILLFSTGMAISVAHNSSTISLGEIMPLARSINIPQMIIVKCKEFTDANDFIEKQHYKAFKYGALLTSEFDWITINVFAIKGWIKSPVIVRVEDIEEISEKISNGSIDAAILNYHSAKKVFDEGQVCPLIVLSDNRLTDNDKIPTARELSIPLSMSSVWGFMIHSTVEDTMSQKIEAALDKAMNHSIYKRLMKLAGLEETSVAKSGTWRAQIGTLIGDIRSVTTNIE